MPANSHADAINPTVWGAVRRFRRLVIGGFVLGILISWIYVTTATPKFAATAGISLAQPPASVAAPTGSDHMTAAIYQNQQIAIMSSTTVVRAAVASVNNKFPQNRLTVAQLHAALSIKAPQPAAAATANNSNLITSVTVTLPDAPIDAKVAAAAANFVVKAYIRYFHASIRAEAKHTIAALSAAIRTTTAKLNGLPPTTSTTIPGTKKKSTKSSTTTSSTVSSTTSTTVAQAAISPTTAGTTSQSTTSSLPTAPTTSTTTASAATTKAARNLKSEKLSATPSNIAKRLIVSGVRNGHTYLRVVTTRSQRTTLAHQGDRPSASRVHAATSSTTSTTTASSTTTSTTSASASSTSTTVVGSGSTVASKAHKNALIQSLATLTKELGTIAINETVDLHFTPVVEVARVPKTAVVRHMSRDLILGAVVGLLIGIIGAFWLSSKMKRFENEEDPGVLYPGTAIVSIPAFDDTGWSHPSLAVLSDPVSEAAEGYRIVATQLRASRTPETSCAVVFAGADLGAGATISVANVALALSEMGEKVIVVDTDVLGRGLTHLLAPASSAFNNAGPGFGELLAGESQVDDVTIPVAIPSSQLRLIPSGSIQNIAIRRWRLDDLRSLLSDLSTHYDFILFDAPPIAAASFGLDLFAGVGNVVMVIPHHDRIDIHLSLCSRINALGTNFVGYIYNGAAPNPNFVPYYPMFTQPPSSGGAPTSPSGPNPDNNDDDAAATPARSNVKVIGPVDGSETASRSSNATSSPTTEVVDLSEIEKFIAQDANSAATYVGAMGDVTERADSTSHIRYLTGNLKNSVTKLLPSAATPPQGVPMSARAGSSSKRASGGFMTNIRNVVGSLPDFVESRLSQLVGRKKP
jgi:Mrp family chromosome partitioning ATPase/uncharacterized protein involved in exopolysaccharide biosynthesis